LFAVGIWGRKAWHVAAVKCKQEALDILMDRSEILQSPEDINNKYLLANVDHSKLPDTWRERWTTQNYNKNHKNGLKRF
jgi:hypothetical protein